MSSHEGESRGPFVFISCTSRSLHVEELRRGDLHVRPSPARGKIPASASLTTAVVVVDTDIRAACLLATHVGQTSSTTPSMYRGKCGLWRIDMHSQCSEGNSTERSISGLFLNRTKEVLFWGPGRAAVIIRLAVWKGEQFVLRP